MSTSTTKGDPSARKVIITHDDGKEDLVIGVTRQKAPSCPRASTS